MNLPILRNGSKLLHHNASKLSAFVATGAVLSIVSAFSVAHTGSAQADTSACTSPTFTTSKADDMKSFGEYIVHNNMWNAGGYNVTQKLEACTAQKWNVTVTADNSKNDGAVKTYPNVHKDYHDWGSGAEPKLDSYTKISSTFGATSPRGSGQIYNVAYDIWLNGVPGNREVMIWTDNWNQTPGGNKVGSVTVAGKSWDFWASGDNHILTFVAPQPMTSGTVDIKAILNYLSQNSRIPANSTLGQIDFGVEVVSTNGQPATFKFTDFSISDSTSATPSPTPAPSPSPTPSTGSGQTQGQTDTSKNAEELPSTGPEAIFGAIAGAAALTYVTIIYVKSRRSLSSIVR